MKTKKISFFPILFGLVLLSSCSVLRNKMTSQTFESIESRDTEIIYSPIHWKKDTLEGNVVKSSFYLPVKIKGIEDELYMQVDLGATRSILYSNTLSAFCEKYPDLKNDIIRKENYSIFNNVAIKINKNQNLKASRLYVLKSFGQTNIDTNFIIIGTLGYDIIGDNVLILDFKNNGLAICNNLPEEMNSKATFIVGADLKKFPIILPFTLGNKKIRLFFDTGASMFPVLTGTKRLKKLSKHRVVVAVDSVSSWGEMIPIYKANRVKEKRQNLTIENINLGKVRIYGETRLNKLNFMGNYLYGITGNVVFENKILIIDRKNNRFAIIE